MNAALQYVGDLRDLELVTRNPEGRGPLMFVHGVSHGAWCWEPHYLPYFAQLGYACHALSLRGHGASWGGERLHAWGLDDYVDDILRLIDTLPQPPVLIGHSMGGALAQRLIERAPRAVRAVVLLASLPPDGYQLFDWLRALRFPGGMWAVVRLNRGQPLRRQDVERLPFCRDGLDPDLVELCRTRLQPESKRAIKEIIGFRISNPNPAGLPMLVLGSPDDRIFGPAAVARTARRYGCSPVLLEGLSHDFMLDRNWQKSAAVIATFLNELPA